MKIFKAQILNLSIHLGTVRRGLKGYIHSFFFHKPKGHYKKFTPWQLIDLIPGYW